MSAYRIFTLLDNVRNVLKLTLDKMYGGKKTAFNDPLRKIDDMGLTSKKMGALLDLGFTDLCDVKDSILKAFQCICFSRFILVHPAE